MIFLITQYNKSLKLNHHRYYYGSIWNIFTTYFNICSLTSGGIIGTINKVADNRELTLEVAENVEIKIASGMVADLYAMPEVQKKEPPKEENKSKSGFSLFSRKK